MRTKADHNIGENLIRGPIDAVLGLLEVTAESSISLPMAKYLRSAGNSLVWLAERVIKMHDQRTAGRKKSAEAVQ